MDDFLKFDLYAEKSVSSIIPSALGIEKLFDNIIRILNIHFVRLMILETADAIRVYSSISIRSSN